MFLQKSQIFVVFGSAKNLRFTEFLKTQIFFQIFYKNLNFFIGMSLGVTTQ
jgi:hypothetical protein